jgi:hypothetical protein
MEEIKWYHALNVEWMVLISESPGKWLVVQINKEKECN